MEIGSALSHRYDVASHDRNGDQGSVTTKPLKAPQVRAGSRRRRLMWSIPFVGLILAACGSGPQTSLDPQGPIARDIDDLWNLVFWIATVIFVIVQAVRKFPSPPTPNEYSRHHLFWAKLAAFEMLMTAVTGWVFYVLAFVM